MAGRRGLLTLDALREQVAAGTIDTVLVAITDMQGRLQGKRCSAEYFLEEVVGHATEACNYLLAVDVDMNTVDGYAISSWDAGYGDFVLRPDFTTLRLVPWQEGTALVLADVERVDGGGPVAVSPRQVLRRQLERLADKKLQAFVGTELEFIVFDDSYEAAWDKRYQGIKPSNQYNVDYSMLGTARVEPLLRRIRNEMAGAGLYPESAKGECNPGQQEIAFRYAEALTTCDNHSVYKNGAKEIAAQEGKSLTFMAKYNEREGNSCHIHLSLRGTDGSAVLPGDGDHGFSKAMEHFLAGQLAALRELTYFFAPNINSYKRFVRGSFAPTAVAWGTDNRTCALRVVGHGDSLRVENRVPGGDVNPYLAVAALIAAGLHGIENELALEPEFTGNAYGSDKPTVPTTLGEAADVLAGSRIAREAFGDDVVDHYLNAARVEREAFEKAVTDWELIRGFERL
ncbi:MULTISPECIES: glutamine synthetase family protein [unclassified Amycolatopsis]|uniref:glutamine synthetase family protein n=1 Tax=unclassified Amycolatopsis TaxID=2618356 RepID=UPI001C6968E6|nr:glutamine synthetase family protein [Amycolatopsis sp. DSM 110486]QYN16623.1 glutamine synthetase family protein [Amycolatopsis sp. DSM 110486]